MSRVLIVGKFVKGSLEISYQRAFAKLGYEVICCDIDDMVRGYARLGRLGRKFNEFVAVEAWVTKANRDIAAQAIEKRVDLFIVMGSWRMRAGTLAQIKVATGAKIVNIWPDTMVNMLDHTVTSLPAYDVFATYSRAGVAAFEGLGAKKALWVPLAGDAELHPVIPASAEQKREFAADVAFVGGWRPEREAVLTALVKADKFDVKIWGPEWGRRCQENKHILSAWQGRPLVGEEFAVAARAAKINLNPIDPTNYPAANMRFFEIPIAGGLQISSDCPEMEREFRHGEEIYYYRNDEELISLVAGLLTDEGRRIAVRERAHRLAQAKHTYLTRARSILEYLEIYPA